MRPLSSFALVFLLGTFVAGCASDFTAPSSRALSDADAIRIGAQLSRDLTASMTVLAEGGNAREIATAVPLAYDASCAAGATTPFRAGEVHARAANADGQATVRIVFRNCQAPAITLVAHN